MKHSEFWESMDDVFGKPYARSLAQDMVLESLGGRSAAEALAAGVQPREVWDALCAANNVPENKRWHFLDDPKKKRRAR